MARNKPPRKKYRPRAVRPNPLSYVLNGFLPVTALKKETLHIRLGAHSAMDELRSGRGTRAHADKVVAVLNMTEAMARVNPELGADWAAEIRAGQDALLAMLVRGVEGGTDRFVFTGPELTAVNLALEIHDAQLDRCTVEVMEKALKLVQQEIRACKARRILEAQA